MFQFVFFAVLLSMPVSNLSMELRFPFKNLQDARLGSFEEVCKWFCEDAYDYFFRTFDDIVNPRIFCGLCQKKLSTTTTASPSTTASTAAPSTTTTPVTSTTTTPVTSSTTTTPVTSSTTTTPVTSSTTTTPVTSSTTTTPETTSTTTVAPP